MTELELRHKVCDKILSWMGLRESDGSYLYILNLYNSHKPLARGYAITVGQPWCATTVSAVSIGLGLTDIMPTEVSCPQMVRLYQKHPLSRWEESDAYYPLVGDIVLYDWQDGNDYANTDNHGEPDHIGIVTSVSGDTLTVTEGNINRAVGQRKLAVNGKYIRGYCLPNYAYKAARMEDEPMRWYTINDIPPSPQQEYYKQEIRRLIKQGVIAGKGLFKGEVIIDFTEDMLRTLLMSERLK